MRTRCAQCNAPMSCCPDGDCWCSDYPPVSASPDATACLCPECLREKLKESQKKESSRSQSAS